MSYWICFKFDIFLSSDTGQSYLIAAMPVCLSLHQDIYCCYFWIRKIDRQWGAKEMTTIKCIVRIPIEDFLLTSSFYSLTSSVISPHFYQTSSSSFTQPHQVNRGQGAEEKKENHAGQNMSDLGQWTVTVKQNQPSNGNLWLRDCHLVGELTAFMFLKWWVLCWGSSV